MAEEPKKKVKLKVSGARSTKAAAEDAAADRESMGQVRKSLVFLDRKSTRLNSSHCG